MINNTALHCDREQSKLASIPGRSQLRKTAWYTLSAHVSIAPSSDVRRIFIFAISNSYVLLSLLNTLGKPEKLYCTGFGQANAEIQSFEEHYSQGKIRTKIYRILMYLGGTYEICC